MELFDFRGRILFVMMLYDHIYVKSYCKQKVYRFVLLFSGRIFFLFVIDIHVYEYSFQKKGQRALNFNKVEPNLFYFQKCLVVCSSENNVLEA